MYTKLYSIYTHHTANTTAYPTGREPHRLSFQRKNKVTAFQKGNYVRTRILKDECDWPLRVSVWLLLVSWHWGKIKTDVKTLSGKHLFFHCCYCKYLKTINDVYVKWCLHLVLLLKLNLSNWKSVVFPLSIQIFKLHSIKVVLRDVHLIKSVVFLPLLFFKIGSTVEGTWEMYLRFK